MLFDDSEAKLNFLKGVEADIFFNFLIKIIKLIKFCALKDLFF